MLSDVDPLDHCRHVNTVSPYHPCPLIVLTDSISMVLLDSGHYLDLRNDGEPILQCPPVVWLAGRAIFPESD